jgi:hypothetical protein
VALPYLAISIQILSADDFARGFGRGSLVPGRSADMDRDAEPAIHGRA